jgi:hypothetical protein
MQGTKDEGEAGDQPPALGAFAEVMLHPASRTRTQFAVEIRRHAIGRPTMIHPEVHAVHELAHSALDPGGRRDDSH